MDIRDLHYFQAICEYDTYEQAAEAVARSKPALLKSVRRLETRLGSKLFERQGRGKKLTPVGCVLLEKARSLTHIAANVEGDVRGYARGEAGVIRIGTGTTPAELILPNVCRRLYAVAPAVRIILLIGMTDLLYDYLYKNEVDLIICPASPGHNSDFEMIPLQDDEVVVAAGANHPLVNDTITLEKLAACDWVLPSRSASNRTWLDNVFIANGLNTPIAKVETDSLSALPKFVEQMNLLTFTGRRSLGSLTEIAHPKTTLSRKYAASIKRDSYRPPAVTKFLGVLEEIYR